MAARCAGMWMTATRDFLRLRMDNSAASLRLWNFLLTEEDRLHEAQAAGKKLVGTMKDLGTVPVMAYALDNLVAFYPDGAWWTPCIMEQNARLLEIADRLGVDDSFCPVRAMLGAFVNQAHFPIPGLLVCSVGATCDDFSAIAQRWPASRIRSFGGKSRTAVTPTPAKRPSSCPAGFRPRQASWPWSARNSSECKALATYASRPLSDDHLAAGIRRANQVRRCLGELRQLVFASPLCPMPALEMLVAEMLAIHYCSDQQESLRVLEDLLDEARRRVEAGRGVLASGAARVLWVNPVADLRAMNLLEDVGGRICGTEYLFSHALDPIPEDLPPVEALARMALADPMVGSSADRAERICADLERFGRRGGGDLTNPRGKPLCNGGSRDWSGGPCPGGRPGCRTGSAAACGHDGTLAANEA